MSKLVCSICGATAESDQPGCSGWGIMEFGGRKFLFCPVEQAKPGATAEEFAAAKKRMQDHVVEVMANEPPPKCQVCGCTELSACVTPAGPCEWIAPGVLCSACLDKIPLPQTAEALLPVMEPLFSESVEMGVPGIVAFHVLATLQLALRHPDFPTNTSEIVEDFARGLQQRLSLTPQLAAICERGWDQKFDVPKRSRLWVPGDPR